MKKSILILALILGLPFASNSQNGYLPNSEFDNWSQVNHYEFPNHYAGSNYTGHSVANITKSTDSQNGTYSLKLETVATSFSPYFGFFLLGTTQNGVTFNGGSPFTTVVDGISGYYKSDIAANDSAAIIVILKNSGAVVSQDVVYFKGTHSAWTPFNFAINTGASVPDTIIWGAVSADPFSGAMGVVGSWLMLDNISFTASGSVDPVPNLDFEDWLYHATDEPSSWYSSNLFSNPLETNTSELPCQEITPGVNGTGSAVMIKTVRNSDGDTLPGLLSYGEIEVDDYDPIIHGQSYFGSPTLLSGYFNKPTTGDDSEMLIEIFENGASIFNQSEIISNATMGFTYFEIPLSYSGTPDSIRLFAYSGDNPGTELHLDSINLSGGNLAVPEFLFEKNVQVYPNPASNYIEIQSALPLVQFELFSLDGKLIKSNTLGSTLTYRIDLSDLDKGNYLLRIQNSQGIQTKQLVLK